MKEITTAANDSHTSNHYCAKFDIKCGLVRYKERSDELAAWKADYRERERIRAEEEAALARERKTIETLVNEAQHWTISQQVRDYVSHIETQLAADGNEIPDAVREWVADSMRRAEQLDPTGTRLSSFVDGVLPSAKEF